MYHNIRWTIEKIAQRIDLLEGLVYRRAQQLPPFRLSLVPDSVEAPPELDPEFDDSAWTELKPNSYWGRWRSRFTLRTALQCPRSWNQNDAPVALYLPLGTAGDFSHPEALVYLDGRPLAACDRHHQEILLPRTYCDGQPHPLVLHGWTGIGGSHSHIEPTKLFLRPCKIVQIDQGTRDFLATARVALGVARALDHAHPARGHLLNALEAAFQALDLREPVGEALYASIPTAHARLHAGIAQAGPAMEVELVATGHAHIDVAWLWTVSETRRKCGRTFHTVLRLMEQFPDYHFTQSQPQLYDYVRQDYPELFQAIGARIREGRWEPIGGMWVEADCNLSGPESLARQFLLGRQFFRDHFGPEAESPVLWLPDVFGYAWNLPQLIKQAGLDYFFTIKIGWNQYNRLPYDSFWWQGLDGTKVLTHFSTSPDPGGYGVSTYNAQATPEEALGAWTLFQQKEAQQTLLMAFGYGDGGGGPTREMLENLREMADFPAVPHIRQTHVGDFFRELEAACGDRLPTWNGELYLELHRGTYTTQARNKRANRKSEFLLHDAEFLASLAACLAPDYRYPTEQLTTAWKLVCLNQFHDIIPGSSIRQVYEDSLAHYEEIRQIGEQVKEAAISIIHQHIQGDLLLINPTSFARQSLAFWPEALPANQRLITAAGDPVTTQLTKEGTLLQADLLPPYSVTALRLVDAAEAAGPQPSDLAVGLEPPFLENSRLRVEFNTAGDLLRIFDKQEQREILPEGATANQFIAFEDRPNHWDAWDVEIFYDDQAWFSDPASSITISEQGPLRVSLDITRRILHSTYTQQISLTRNSLQLDFVTTIQWQERKTFLKAAFPIDVLTPTATYEVQWGNVERPTHRNTSWDWARFEVCAQKWVDLSEGNYGVSLLNDCKYGHDIQDNVIRLSLLRGTTSPDPEADQGEHHFAYSLRPHAGRWNAATIAAAYALNDPVILARTDGEEQAGPATFLQDGQPFIAVDSSNIVIETIKQAEDGRGLIVRLYESQRHRGTVTLRTSFPLASADVVNLLEEHQTDLETGDHHLNLFVTPYQIVTLRLVPLPVGTGRCRSAN